MFLLLPFFKPVYYIFMTYSCTSTTHLRPLWNLEPQCLISLCITMPYPNPSISIHIHRHIYIYIYPSYPSNHIYQIMSISIVRSVNIHRIHDFHHINISTNQSIYILIYVYIYLFIYLAQHSAALWDFLPPAAWPSISAFALFRTWRPKHPSTMWYTVWQNIQKHIQRKLGSNLPSYKHIWDTLRRGD